MKTAGSWEKHDLPGKRWLTEGSALCHHDSNGTTPFNIARDLTYSLAIFSLKMRTAVAHCGHLKMYYLLKKFYFVLI